MILEIEMPITDEIRRKLKAALSEDRTLYRVAKDNGLSWSTLNRCVGGGGLISDHIDALATYLSLEVVKSAAPKKSAPSKGRKM